MPPAPPCPPAPPAPLDDDEVVSVVPVLEVAVSPSPPQPGAVAITRTAAARAALIKFGACMRAPSLKTFGQRYHLFPARVKRYQPRERGPHLPYRPASAQEVLKMGPGCE